ncbi:MAG: LytTR family DNA-binding domain-containing protein [Flammeovirgaceae bacterium]|nr:LytTR family DNA-binding domain-containing protein [Flammeovirgaceae bacterium]
MAKVTCIIIEDEKPAQEVLKSYISKTDWLSLASVFEDAIEAMDFLKKNEVDLIFLDIQIPGISGIEFLKILKNSPQVIITTAFSEYALDAFELDVRDYLKKPFSFDRFLKAVNRIALQPDPSQIHQLEPRTNAEQSFAFFNVNKMMVKVLFSNIRYIESMREYVYIHQENEKIVTKIGISEIEKLLGGNFLRTHRSYIVNIDKVSAYNAEEIFVGKTSLPIGTNYKKLVGMMLNRGNTLA